MKWGTRYNYNYVNNLYEAIQKHTLKPTKLICFTDDDSNISNSVLCRALPKINIPKEISKTPWRKLSIWQYPLFDLDGDNQ